MSPKFELKEYDHQNFMKIVSLQEILLSKF